MGIWQSEVDAPEDSTPPVTVIAGPTGSGKTALGIAVAEAIGGEIVSADAMQVYRGMEIGTAAPTDEERARVPHHLVACVAPDERVSAGWFSRQARAILSRLAADGKPAVVVGGSGLYINALVDGLFPGPGRQPAIRARLYREARELGNGALLSRLAETDPDYAETLSSENDLVRIVRALEVCEVTGEPFSALHAAHRAETAPLKARQFALDWPRDTLYHRINARVDRMVAAGWVAEVEALVEGGYSAELERIKALGYREILAALRGEQSIEDAIERTKMHHRRYAKRQLSWFRNDERVCWLPVLAENWVDTLVEHVCAPVSHPA